MICIDYVIHIYCFKNFNCICCNDVQLLSTYKKESNYSLTHNLYTEANWVQSNGSFSLYFYPTQGQSGKKIYIMTVIMDIYIMHLIHHQFHLHLMVMLALQVCLVRNLEYIYMF